MALCSEDGKEDWVGVTELVEYCGCRSRGCLQRKQRREGMKGHRGYTLERGTCAEGGYYRVRSMGEKGIGTFGGVAEKTSSWWLLSLDEAMRGGPSVGGAVAEAAMGPR